MSTDKWTECGFPDVHMLPVGKVWHELCAGLEELLDLLDAPAFYYRFEGEYYDNLFRGAKYRNVAAPNSLIWFDNNLLPSVRDMLAGQYLLEHGITYEITDNEYGKIVIPKTSLTDEMIDRAIETLLGEPLLSADRVILEPKLGWSAKWARQRYLLLRNLPLVVCNGGLLTPRRGHIGRLTAVSEIQHISTEGDESSHTMEYPYFYAGIRYSPYYPGVARNWTGKVTFSCGDQCTFENVKWCFVPIKSSDNYYYHDMGTGYQEWQPAEVNSPNGVFDFSFTFPSAGGKDYDYRGLAGAHDFTAARLIPKDRSRLTGGRNV